MLIFPIKRPPIVTWNQEREDNVYRSPAEYGYKMTRPRFTKARRTLGPFTWQYLNDAEHEILMDFYDNITACGSLPFQFTVSTRSRKITKNVRFSAPPKETYIGYDKWLVQCTFEEV